MMNRDHSSPCCVAFQAGVPAEPTPFVGACFPASQPVPLRSVRGPGLCALSVLLAMAPSQAHASTVPSAPASPMATPGIAGASVSFTPSVSDGGAPIIRYTVTSSPDGIAATGGAPPIAVSGLTNGTSYTFTVTATNINGPSAASAASNTVIPSAALAPWYNTLWTERKTIAVTGSAAAQTNYPVKLTLPYAAGMKADFSDLRFTDSSGTLLLNYWIETETDNSTAVVWVKAPSVPIAPNTAAIYAYYGNPAAVSLSNGDTTFTFFDTFGGLRPSRGDVGQNQTVDVSTRHGLAAVRHKIHLEEAWLWIIPVGKGPHRDAVPQDGMAPTCADPLCLPRGPP